MSGDLRHRIAEALADHEQQDLGLDADRYPAERWLCCADAVLAVLDQTFPPMLALDPPPEMNPEDVAAWQAAWAEAVDGDTRQRLMVLPPPDAPAYAYEDLLGSIELYIDWRRVTRNLTTDQRELFADAVDASRRRVSDDDQRAVNGVPRWWRDEYAAGDSA